MSTTLPHSPDAPPDDAGAALPRPATNSAGVLGRLRANAQKLSEGRRLVIPLPGWTDPVLWARFEPISQQDAIDIGATRAEDVDVVARVLARRCEEILFGDERASAHELGLDLAGPARFSAEFGELLGIGGESDEAVVKRMLITGEDDTRFFAVAGSLLNWSTRESEEAARIALGE